MTHPSYPGWTCRKVLGALAPGGRSRELYELEDPDGQFHFVSIREDGALRDTVKGHGISEACDVVRALLGLDDTRAA